MCLLSSYYIVSFCDYSYDSVYVGVYCGLRESRLCVFGKLYPVGFAVYCKSLLQSIVMSYVDCDDDG